MGELTLPGPRVWTTQEATRGTGGTLVDQAFPAAVGPDRHARDLCRGCAGHAHVSSVFSSARDSLLPPHY